MSALNYLALPADSSWRTEVLLRKACLLEVDIQVEDHLSRTARHGRDWHAAQVARLRRELASICEALGI